ncbi:copper resistance protein CopC [Peribacillus sp. FSL E2-0159]|uniref:copper resistance CopC family protein n=1 Tax=Peribacillus sp. FSL E2-0159 TaxID=2975289 RepID=UPI00315A0903
MKKSLYILFFILFTFSSSVSAHTGLENSSPSNGDTITEEIQEITMEFETELETGSSFSLLNDGEKEIPVSDIQIDGNKLTGTSDDPLENGKYTVIWNIIGEDGHIIDGEYGFTVAKANANKESTKSPTEMEEDKSPTIEEPEKNPEQSPAVNTAEEETQSNTNFIAIFVGLFFLVVIIVTVWLMRKGKK